MMGKNLTTLQNLWDGDEMTEFTSEFIAELKNIVSKATPTPYYFCVYPDQISENETHPLEDKELKIIACPGDGNHIFGIFAEGEWVNDYFDFVENNAEYIVIACNNLPKALDHIERLQKRIEELSERNQKLITENSKIAGKLAHYYVRAQQLEQERRWIPVSEPPKESGVYITAYRSMFGGNNLITSTSYFKVEDGWTPGNVKYWQPIPQPPQDGET